MDIRSWSAAAVLAALMQGACGSAPPPKPVSRGPVDPYAEGDIGAHAVPGAPVEVRVIAIHSMVGKNVIPCWIVVTRGLEAAGHAELSLMIKREENESPDAYPRDAVTVLGDLGRKVVAGQQLRVWQLLDIPRGFLGRPDFGGLIVAPPDTPGYSVPRPPLSLVAITAEELEVARRFGAGRVAGLLGLHYRHYPTGTWIERQRPAVATATALRQSTLAAAGSSVVLEDAAIWHEPAPNAAAGTEPGRVVVLQLGGSAARGLATALQQAGPRGTALVMAPPAGNTDVSLVWTAERNELGALGRPGRDPVRYAAAFLAFPQQPDKPGARLVEDGYVVQMTREQQLELLKALHKHRPFAIAPAGGRHAFELRWSTCVVQIRAGDAAPDCIRDPSRARAPEDDENDDR